MPKSVTILIADDHALVRRGVKVLLEGEDHFKVVAEARNGEEAIEMAHTNHPDVAVLDIRMPGMSGIEACRQIISSGEGCKVIMLTAYAEDELLFAAIQAGAAGYVLKLVGGAELIHAVEHVSNGEGFIDSSMIGSVFAEVNKATGAQHAAHFSMLTSREMQILTLVSKGQTNRQIGSVLYLAEGTIRNYVSSVLTKLMVANRAEAAAFAVKHSIDQLVATS
ncbi:MAG: response regulator transcription factor [Anaerolineae bacterium]|nr:response regulator transcription factor [Anaerolineae bacterium]